MLDATSARIDYSVPNEDDATAAPIQGHRLRDLLPESWEAGFTAPRRTQVVAGQVAEQALAYFSRVLSPDADVSALYGERRSQTSARPSLPAELQELAAQVVRAFEDEPFEYGRSHPVEETIERVLRDFPGNAASWVKQVVDSVAPFVSADFLRCLGRQGQAAREGWGYEIAKEALKSESTVIRDAAVVALEGWGGPQAVSALEGHRDREPEGWLRDYIGQVIEDLRPGQ